MTKTYFHQMLLISSLLAICHSIGVAGELDATHVEVDPIKFEIGPNGKITTMAMDAAGNLLVGVSWGDKPVSPQRRPAARPSKKTRRRPNDDNDNRKYAIKVVSPKGTVRDTWSMKDVIPKMIHGNDDGTVYVAGQGAVVLYDQQGKQLKKASFADVLDGEFKDAHASGVTACKDYFFIAFGHGFSLRATEDIVRFDRDLTNAKLIIKTQYGCCSHIDLDVKGDTLLIAENSRHRVNSFTFNGMPTGRWGSRDRSNIEGFAACCNPVNFDFGPNDVLYTAESGVGRIKKYSAAGKYLGLVGYVDTTKFDRGSYLASQSCYIPIEVGKDAKRVYVMDVRAHFIRVLEEQNGSRK